MKKVFLVFIIALAQNAFGQDSIYKKNGEVIASKIQEINPTDVKFKKFENLDGPTYSELISELWYIRFENGTVDTVGRVAAIPDEETSIASYDESKSLGIKPNYPYHMLNEHELFLEIQNLPSSSKKTKMLKEYDNLKEYKSAQTISRAGLIAGFVVPTFVSCYTIFNAVSNANVKDPVTTIIIGAIAGAAIRTTAHVIYKVNKNKRANSKKLIVEMFKDLN